MFSGWNIWLRRAIAKTDYEVESLNGNLRRKRRKC